MSHLGDSPPAPLSPRALAGLLIGLRLRLLRNRLRGGPNLATARVAAAFALLIPLAYLGLFLSAFEVIGLEGGVLAQSAAIYLVATAIALSSGALKVAGGEAVIGVGGESEFLLARPLSLPTLVLARGLAGVVTDLTDGLFLLPILAAAALGWAEADGIGPGILVVVPVAALSSLLVQLAVTSLAQAVQIALVRLLPPERRRLAWTLAALGGVLAMALLWMAGSLVLRAPQAAAEFLLAERPWLRLLPGALIAAPVLALREGSWAGAISALGALAGISAAALALAWWVARLCTRRGWEQADAPWTAGRAPSGPARLLARRAPGLSLYRKDWLLFMRDRARLVAFLGMPALFVGIQVFGSAGWTWLSVDVTRLALVAYSLAAYAATFGPLQHMGAERRAFWILRTVPVSIGRLLAAKAVFWAAVVAGMAALIFVLMVWLAGAPLGRATLGLGVLVVLGAGAVSFLAVGLAAGVADLSDERRPPVGLGITYLFLLVAGLYNVALLQASSDGPRALLLYAVSAAVAWITGARRAGELFDAEATGRATLSPTLGALAVVLLFLGERATRTVTAALGAPDLLWAQLPFIALVGAGVIVHRLRRARPTNRTQTGRALGCALAFGLLGGLAGRLLGVPVELAAAPALLVASRALVEEVAIRGVIQAGLHPAAGSRTGRISLALVLLLPVLTAWSVSEAPFAGTGLAAAIAPSLAYSLTGRLWVSLVTRGLIEALSRLP